MIEALGAGFRQPEAIFHAQAAPGGVEEWDINRNHHAWFEYFRAARTKNGRLKLDDTHAVQGGVEKVLPESGLCHHFTPGGFDLSAFWPGAQSGSTGQLGLPGSLKRGEDRRARVADEDGTADGGVIAFVTRCDGQ